MTNFEIFCLSELGSFRNGVNFSKRDFGNYHPLINVKQLYHGRFIDTKKLVTLRKGVTKNIKSYSVKYGDILFARSSLMASGAGQVAMVADHTPETLFSGFIIRFRLEKTEKANPLYINYLLRSSVYRQIFQNIANGTTITNLTQEVLGNVQISLPPLPIQERIAEILGSLDDKIELNRRMNATLEAAARAIFKSWFVDFDPVYAKMEGRGYPLPAEVLDLFPDELVESELGLIPKGWEVGNLGDIAKNIRNATHPSDVSSDTNYIGLEHMPRKSIALDSWESAQKISSNKYSFKHGQILFGKLRPYFHKVGIAPVDGICSTDILVIQNSLKSTYSFIIFLISSSKFVNEISAASTGTKMPRTSWKYMKDYPVVLPSKNILDVFEKLITPMLMRIIQNVHSSITLAEMRDTLLPKLMSGDIEV